MVNDFIQCQNVWNDTYQNQEPDTNGTESVIFPWEDESALPSEIIGKFIGEISINDQTRILDFGCGTGRIGRYIERNWENLKHKVYYYDIANVVFEKYLNDIPESQQIRPSINEIDYDERCFHEKDQFDGIVVWGVLHHLPQNLRENVWRLIKRILKPNGHLLVAEFNETDVLFKDCGERLSEITNNLTYAVSPIAMTQDSFDIRFSGIFNFKENQRLLNSYSYTSDVDKCNRIDKERTLEYIIATPNWLESQKNIFTRDMITHADFSHLLVYEFKRSLNNPENRIGTYYSWKENNSRELWLKAMGLMFAYDKIYQSSLMNSSYSSLLFKDSLKRYSFIAESRINKNSGEPLEIKIIKNEETLCDNLFNITLLTSKRLSFGSFEKAYKDKKGEAFSWTFVTPDIHDNGNSYHRGALEKIDELQKEGLEIYDSESDDIRNYLRNLDEVLKCATENFELEDSIVDAIRLILLFITPTDLKVVDSSSPIEKTYTAIVPPAFATEIKDYDTNEAKVKQITAGGAIMFTIGTPFDENYPKEKFIHSVLKWSSALTTKSLISFTQKESIKSAIAAIMSRNMSHNLGSHFLANTKNYFNALVDVDEGNASIYRGVKNALQYIQERMDFIATITSNDVLPYGAVNAKAQIFDELTPDDLGFRHNKKSLNFLLDYLVLSEKISKMSFNKNYNLKVKPSEDEKKLYLSMGYEDEKGVVTFWNSSEKDLKEENDNRDKLVNINLAIPGGILGRHAVFSIIENVIRNAAKHGQDKIHDNLTIKMLCTNDGHFVIFDNKSDPNIRETVCDLKNRLDRMEMVNSNNTMNQENKGLKEILTCAAWLQNADVAQVFQSKNFDEYVNILAVNKEGKPLPTKETEGYLGYRIKLERFRKRVHLDKELGIDESANEIDFSKIEGIKADVVCASKDYKVGESKLSEIFPRFHSISISDFNKKNEDELLECIVKSNCQIDTTNVHMVVSNKGNNNFNSQLVLNFSNYTESPDKRPDDFLFKGHAGKSKLSKFETLYLTEGFEDKYIDSISGGDFTHTIVQPSFVADRYNLLKVVESVKTRFVIIDERIFEQYHSSMNEEKRQQMLNGIIKIKAQITNGGKEIDNLYKYVFTQCKVLGNISDDNSQEDKLKAFLNGEMFDDFVKKDIEQHYLERKNIFLFSIDRDGSDRDKSKYVLKDLSFNRLGVINDLDGKVSENEKQYFNDDPGKAPVTFLSIHLGLIDKVKDSLGKANDKNFDESEIVESLKKYFGAKFVSIHSGRGGYDIRKFLRKYVFQSYSAVENPLHNSKFLLSQQFYNLNYYGTRR